MTAAPAPPPADPPATKLRVGLIADEEQSPALVAALSASPHFELVAAAGYPHLRELPGIEWHDDTRVMIAQGAIEALVLATSTRDALDFHESAATRQLPVWRPPPLGRSFPEATHFVADASKRGQVVRVASWWEYVREAVRPALQSAEDFKARFTEVSVRAPGPPLPSWRSGVVDAGGGALALDAYPMLEALLALRGLPDNVSAATGRYRKAPGQPPRETEDVATAIFRYEGGGVASVRATWDVPPDECQTRYDGLEAALTLSLTEARAVARDGSVVAAVDLPQTPLAFEFERFASLIAAGGADEVNARTLERHIALTAVLEAAYLSARTWAPESPRKFYEVQGWRLPRP